MIEKQIHGLYGIAVDGKEHDWQEISVTDGDGIVWVRRTSYASAGLTPDEAEWFAARIVEAAKRVRIRADKSPDLSPCDMYEESCYKKACSPLFACLGCAGRSRPAATS